MSWPITLLYLVDPDAERVWWKRQKTSDGCLFTFLGWKTTAADVYLTKNFMKYWPIKKSDNPWNRHFFVAWIKWFSILLQSGRTYILKILKSAIKTKTIF